MFGARQQQQLILYCSKYRFMEKSFTQKKLGLEEKMAEFKETLGVLSLLDSKKVRSAYNTMLREDVDWLHTHYRKLEKR